MQLKLARNYDTHELQTLSSNVDLK